MDPETWSTPGWRHTATVWLDTRLAEAGLRRTGFVEQPHLRPWATALRAPTTGGDVWLKAAGPATASEVGVYEALLDAAPHNVLEPLALDADRAWMLLPDGGRPLGERSSGDGVVEAMITVLPAYAELQRALAPQADRLVDGGTRDMRPDAMAGRIDEALIAVEAVAGNGTDHAALQRVAEHRDVVLGWCAELAAAPGPATLDHHDLHPWNIVVADDEPVQQARFYDWGDSVVAHPFSSMLVALTFAQRQLGVSEHRTDRMRDAYLEPFTDLASLPELVAAMELACRVGKVARALTWARVVAAMEPGPDRDEWARAAVATLTSTLDESHLGGA